MREQNPIQSARETPPVAVLVKRGTTIAGAVAAAALLAGCAHTPAGHHDVPVLRYTGSSTIAQFIRDAEPAYGKVRFTLNTEPESTGGELALLSGETDLAGVAARPSPETLNKGVAVSSIGQDAIAVVINQANPITGLTRDQLREIFSGKIRNWKEVGGPNLAIKSYIVGPASATRKVFRSAVLGEADYAGCELVQPDSAIPMNVEAEAGAIGHVSFAFLVQCGHVKALAVDGQPPSPSNADYPISRPLYLLWWPGRAQVADFISWTRSSEARAILLKRFALPRSSVASQPEGGEP